MLFLLCSLLGSLSSRDTSQPACLPCLPDPPPRRLLDFHGPLRVTLVQSTFMEGFENNVLLPWILYFHLHKHLGRYCYCQSEIRGTEGVRDFHVTTELRDFHVTTEQSHHSTWPSISRESDLICCLSLFWWGGRAVLWGPWRWSC